MSNFAERANNGATLLDDCKPGWYREIDLTRFAIVSIEDCIVGQLFIDWVQGMYELEHLTSIPFRGNRGNQEAYGFELTEDEYDSESNFPAEELETRWAVEITNRMADEV